MNTEITPLNAVRRLYDLFLDVSRRIMILDINNIALGETVDTIFETTDEYSIRVYINNKIITGTIQFANLECHLYFDFQQIRKTYSIGINYAKKHKELTLSQRRFLLNHGFQYNNKIMIRDFI